MEYERSVTYSQYASSRTTITLEGTASRKETKASSGTIVPVGLFGLQIQITLVRSVIRASIPSRSCVPFTSGTSIDTALSMSALLLYTEKVWSAMIVSSPGKKKARAISAIISSEPQPKIILSLFTPRRLESAEVNSTAEPSG
ncbi:hypothetical protein D3C76_1232020 [compost metagenome]